MTNPFGAHLLTPGVVYWRKGPSAQAALTKRRANQRAHDGTLVEVIYIDPEDWQHLKSNFGDLTGTIHLPGLCS